jgi:hypothetical protein
VAAGGDSIVDCFQFYQHNFEAVLLGSGFYHGYKKLLRVIDQLAVQLKPEKHLLS